MLYTQIRNYVLPFLKNDVERINDDYSYVGVLNFHNMSKDYKMVSNSKIFTDKKEALEHYRRELKKDLKKCFKQMKAYRKLKDINIKTGNDAFVIYYKDNKPVFAYMKLGEEITETFSKHYTVKYFKIYYDRDRVSSCKLINKEYDVFNSYKDALKNAIELYRFSLKENRRILRKYK